MRVVCAVVIVMSSVDPFFFFFFLFWRVRFLLDGTRRPTVSRRVCLRGLRVSFCFPPGPQGIPLFEIRPTKYSLQNSPCFPRRQFLWFPRSLSFPAPMKNLFHTLSFVRCVDFMNNPVFVCPWSFTFPELAGKPPFLFLRPCHPKTRFFGSWLVRPFWPLYLFVFNPFMFWRPNFPLVFSSDTGPSHPLFTIA